MKLAQKRAKRTSAPEATAKPAKKTTTETTVATQKAADKQKMKAAAAALLEEARRYDDLGNDLTTVEGTRAAEDAYAVREAASKAGRAEIAKQIAALVAEYDAVDVNFFTVRGAADFLVEIEERLISAAGLVATHMLDEAPLEADQKEALRHLSIARSALDGACTNFRDAGVLAAVAEKVQS